jgi:hypothetical protein
VKDQIRCLAVQSIEKAVNRRNHRGCDMALRELTPFFSLITGASLLKDPLLFHTVAAFTVIPNCAVSADAATEKLLTRSRSNPGETPHRAKHRTFHLPLASFNHGLMANAYIGKEA